MSPYEGLTPVPSGWDTFAKIESERKITDIIHPWFMDVHSVRTYTYPRYRALHVSSNKSEHGYGLDALRVAYLQKTNQPMTANRQTT